MKKLIVFIFVLFLVSGLVVAQDPDATDEQITPSFNVCCEKTVSGAWCQNTNIDQCDEGYRSSPTSCDATSFCEGGICIDSEEGICSKNTPKKVCELTTGTWVEDDENLPQCSLGCCLIGDQSSFVTLTRCKRLSNIYGLETNFRTDVTDEAQCVLLAFAQDKGACVFETDSGRDCRFTTRQECSGSDGGDLGGNVTGQGEFFRDYLCSADELATNCGPTRETTCVDGKDEVYFVDSCGNLANIYDANRVYSNDPRYWQKVVSKGESCRPGDPNIESSDCGNCDYLGGSICGEGRAKYGDNFCRDLNCYDTQNGESYRNGESWCEYMGEQGNGKDGVGSRQFRHVCIQGEEVIEPCSDFRNEVCIEERHGPEFGDFIEAACRVNRWTECIDQFTEEDCLNEDQRDCFWVQGLHYDGSASNSEVKNLADQEDEASKNRGVLEGGHICLPANPPGLEFWGKGSAKEVCSFGNSKQVVEFKTNILGTKTCKENCEVLETGWTDVMNKACVSLGDCGAHVNFLGVYTDGGIAWKQNGKRKSIQTGLFENFANDEYVEVTSEEIEEGSYEEFEEVNEEETTVFEESDGGEDEKVFNQ